MQLLHLTEALAKRWEGRQIVILIDEIFNSQTWLNSLAEHIERIPQCVKLILILNPLFSLLLPTSLPESFLHIDLATPYRSTKAITSLAHFLAELPHYEVVPEGEFGSDVEGKKPIVFDVGKDEVKLREMLQRTRDLFGKDATLLYDISLPSSMREICQINGKEEGGPWECYNAFYFFGSESDHVVAVTTGGASVIEMATRAKTRLILILAEAESEDRKQNYKDYQKHFQAAAEKGLLELAD